MLYSKNKSRGFNNSGVKRFTFNDAAKLNKTFTDCVKAMKSAWDTVADIEPSFGVRVEFRAPATAFNIRQLKEISRRLLDVAPHTIAAIPTAELTSYRCHALDEYQGALRTLATFKGRLDIVPHVRRVLVMFIKALSSRPDERDGVRESAHILDVAECSGKAGWHCFSHEVSIPAIMVFSNAPEPIQPGRHCEPEEEARLRQRLNLKYAKWG